MQRLCKIATHKHIAKNECGSRQSPGCCHKRFGFPTLQEDMEDGQPLSASPTGWGLISSITSSGTRGLEAGSLQLPHGLPSGQGPGTADALSCLPLPELPAAVREHAEVFMLEHAYPDALSRFAVSQATSRDPVLSQVVKAVAQGEELVQRAYSHKATKMSLQQSCLLWGSRVVLPLSPIQGPAVAACGSSWHGKDQNGGPVQHLVAWPGPGHMVQSCEVCQEHQRASRHVEMVGLAPLARPATADPPGGARLAQAAPGVATPDPSTPLPDRYSPG
ncbi:uncharacterized protein [Dermacentor albipictus]|uniref:uncharacterized protein isoform X2 n=1 Tax=Dermacentor albipictus TaxID=60249 RepID=UPI0031FC1601